MIMACVIFLIALIISRVKFVIYEDGIGDCDLVNYGNDLMILLLLMMILMTLIMIMMMVLIIMIM